MMLDNHTSGPLSEWKIANNSEFQSFSFELNYFPEIARLVLRYWHLSYYVGFVYIGVIFGLQRWMKNKSPYSLRPALVLWNSALSLFSITVLLRTLPQFINIISQENGFYKSICVKEGLYPQTAFWASMFVVSKLIELGDTIFIVLRKRPLVFIHWYHHLIILIVAFTNAPFHEPVNIWYVVLNSAVHSVMYLYFAAKTIPLPVPNFMTKMLTTIQFLQMIIGFYVNLRSIYLNGVMGSDCARETYSIIGSCIMGVSFLYLFGNLFFNSFRKVEKHQKLA